MVSCANKEELFEKIKYYFNHSLERKKVAVAGRMRLLDDYHDNISRAGHILSIIVKVKNDNYQ